MSVHPFWSHHYDFSYDFRIMGRIVERELLCVQNLKEEPWNSVSVPLHQKAKILHIGVHSFDSSLIFPTS